MTARQRFLLAICRNMKWVAAGIFASEPEAAREGAIAATQETGDSKIIELRASDDLQVVIASLKRALVITRYQGPDRRTLLVGFYFPPPHPNPLVNTHRRPAFRPTTWLAGHRASDRPLVALLSGGRKHRHPHQIHPSLRHRHLLRRGGGDRSREPRALSL